MPDRNPTPDEYRAVILTLYAVGRDAPFTPKNLSDRIPKESIPDWKAWGSLPKGAIARMTLACLPVLLEHHLIQQEDQSLFQMTDAALNLSAEEAVEIVSGGAGSAAPGMDVSPEPGTASHLEETHRGAAWSEPSDDTFKSSPVNTGYQEQPAGDVYGDVADDIAPFDDEQRLEETDSGAAEYEDLEKLPALEVPAGEDERFNVRENADDTENQPDNQAYPDEDRLNDAGANSSGSGTPPRPQPARPPGASGGFAGFGKARSFDEVESGAKQDPFTARKAQPKTQPTRPQPPSGGAEEDESPPPATIGGFKPRGSGTSGSSGTPDPFANKSKRPPNQEGLSRAGSDPRPPADSQFKPRDTRAGSERPDPFGAKASGGAKPAANTPASDKKGKFAGGMGSLLSSSGSRQPNQPPDNDPFSSGRISPRSSTGRPDLAPKGPRAQRPAVSGISGKPADPETTLVPLPNGEQLEIPRDLLERLIQEHGSLTAVMEWYMRGDLNNPDGSEQA